MSLTALFIIGFVVTLIVASAVTLLIYAAVLDGRRQRELTETGALRVIDRDVLFGDPAPDPGPEPLAAA